ncbi:hypothetical protein AX760_09490 [Pararhizobium antarcticum]|uniref:Plasmid stabilization protein n=1 Tax=Pararhizobium antarcticum TaxID=1798805 RepID=A0A657LZE6_9HYPH|nr:hypothetical protein AX761_18490 [Rhizobium sp. 58]OJG00803.1 hypothetical protein AX760_09490 [Pararhizobium antarcticum]
MRPKRFRLSRLASRDLVEIYKFIAEKNPIAADRLVDELQQKIERFASLGMTGVSREEFREGLRAFFYKNYIIYFRSADSDILVLRIRHGKQKNRADDFPESDMT